MRNYGRALWKVPEILPVLEPRPYQMHSLRAFWGLLLPWPHAAFVLTLASTTAVLALAFIVWKSKRPLGVRFSALLVATVLVSPHLTVYDLVILAPAFLLLSDYCLQSPVQRPLSAVPALLYACYPLFLLGPLARYTHVQLSVPVMMALLWTGNAATLVNHDHSDTAQY